LLGVVELEQEVPAKDRMTADSHRPLQAKKSLRFMRTPLREKFFDDVRKRLRVEAAQFSIPI
jgi:hypothetical protein